MGLTGKYRRNMPSREESGGVLSTNPANLLYPSDRLARKQYKNEDA
jgi:hypothetical protein